jgi:hypothetical protein
VKTRTRVKKRRMLNITLKLTSGTKPGWAENTQMNKKHKNIEKTFKKFGD